jgi:urea carboxylase
VQRIYADADPPDYNISITMFSKILVANRGEILVRICNTLRRLNIASVAVYADADRFAPGVLAADEAVAIGPSPPAASYLNIEAIIAAARATGAEAVHPGYGFLSENVEFAERLAAAGLVFIGPSPTHLRDFGLKHTARARAQAAGVKLLPGTGLLATPQEAVAAAQEIGFPVMLKSAAGGGGIGMALCETPEALAASFENIARLAANNFGNASLFLETYVTAARHIEVQVFGLGDGRVIALGTRDCSLQRRNQKVIEEAPAPNISPDIEAALQDAAVKLCASVNYSSAGTVEFVYDAATQQFYFLEVNTRLQVEHGVTEARYGIDLVEWMIRHAAGGLTPPALISPQGTAIEARLYAEIPAANFRPSTGTITAFTPPPGLRVDGWIEPGTEISPYYDPMLAKLIAHAPTRAAAIAQLQAGLAAVQVGGVETNAAYCIEALALPAFAAGEMTTRSLDTLHYQPRDITVIEPGALSTLQSLPGRLGYWEVGIPPSGPMDDVSHRAANALVGNPPGAATLELTLTGPTLQFAAAATAALTGAAMSIKLDSTDISPNVTFEIAAGQTLHIGAITGPGQRSYLAVAGGFAAPAYLGSTATFALGGFGGHTGFAVRAGDTLRVNPAEHTAPTTPQFAPLTHDWQLDVRYGPHGAPDFFEVADIETLFTSPYEVHHNSARTGIRLIGPKPAWARPDGGEAGLHPSNIHDNAYAVGAIDFTGDMPILLGPDGPSLGGFVCPAVITKPDLWKMGQLKPGDTVRFRRADDEPAILSRFDDITIRRAGDEDLLIEFGPITLDFELRLRAQALRDALAAQAVPGVIDLTPGIRSLQVHFDSDVTTRAKILSAIDSLIPHLPAPDEMVVPSRTLHLPLSWNDELIQLAMRKYQETTRPDAPWCPDNIEFIRRINGLPDIESVKQIVFNAAYVVLGLGDVYLGAPVATPYDPRHRLVTTKYNPARPWTPQNAVGIGGAYMCIYGMEGPGGYQLFGRTIQVWDTYRQKPPFAPGQPWLLRHFDMIRFHQVSHDELEDARARFPHGRYPVRIEENQKFSLKDYRLFLEKNEASINEFQATQRAAFAAERADWAARGLLSFTAADAAPAPDEDALGLGERAILSPVPGSLWRVLVDHGQKINAGDVLMVIESMKMEIEVKAAVSGRVTRLSVEPGQPVRAGQRLGAITP